VRLAASLDERVEQLRRAEDEHEQVVKKLAAALQELDETRGRCEDAVNAAVSARNSLRDQLNDLDARHLALTQENTERTWRENLVARLFARDGTANRGLAAFRELMADYMDVDQTGTPLIARTVILRELQSIYHDLEDLTRAGGGARRKMLGIAGGFSSGKSEFINSFIDDPAVRLKVGLGPVTAIPTYIFAAEMRAITVTTSTGSSVSLDAAQLRELSAASMSQC
jgi:prefoldin subunit 5